ncbi:MAG TPA: hypothetical protein VHZ97_00150 [Pseudonocardiaceae bacterium]|nr:hypothetical protein [Pseudonocardiaceae bacterium]
MRWWRLGWLGSWWLRRVAIALAVLIAVCALPLGGGFAGLTIEGLGNVDGAPSTRGTDAAWLGHSWVTGAPTGPAFTALVAHLRGFRDAFVHVGPLADNGTLDPALAPHAADLLAALHRALPDLRVQAWLGDVVAPDRLDLADPATRTRIVASARHVLGLGFAGVHYDLEPVPTGDAGYLALLTATHVMTSSRQALLSVAVDQIEPAPGLARPEQWLAGRAHWWSTGFLAQVAARVDEIAVMSYDTAVPTTTAYAGYVRIQTNLALRAIPADVTLLMGLPAYHTDELGHTDAETVAAAIRGVRLALRGTDRVVGVAFYAEFAATPWDWAAYQRDWVRPAA